MKKMFVAAILAVGMVVGSSLAPFAETTPAVAQGKIDHKIDTKPIPIKINPGESVYLQVPGCPKVDELFARVRTLKTEEERAEAEEVWIREAWAYLFAFLTFALSFLVTYLLYRNRKLKKSLSMKEEKLETSGEETPQSQPQQQTS